MTQGGAPSTGRVPARSSGVGDHGRGACHTLEGAGQNEACWPHWAEGEIAGRLGTTGAESVAGKASSAIPAVVPEQEQGRGCQRRWQTRMLQGTRGEGFRGALEAGLCCGSSPVPRLTGTRDSSLSRLAMWCKKEAWKTKLIAMAEWARSCGSRPGEQVPNQKRMAGLAGGRCRMTAPGGPPTGLSPRGLRAHPKDLGPGTIRRAAAQLSS